MTMTRSAAHVATVRRLRTTTKIGIAVVLLVAAVAVFTDMHVKLPPVKYYFVLGVAIGGFLFTIAMLLRNTCFLRECATYYLMIAAMFVGTLGGVDLVIFPIALAGWFALLWDMRDANDWKGTPSRF